MSTKRSLTAAAASPGAKSMKSALPVVAVVSLPDHPALADMPHDAAEFIVGDSVEALGPRLAAAEALMWVPGSPPALLTTLWEGGHVPKARWVHSFFAGVDALGPFMRGPLASRPDVPLTNGRGAFSSSLAEWAFTAALHFNKQIPRCVENRKAGKWDKFVMGELRGKTLGLAGFGDIGKAIARMGKAFGMRVVALRRNAGKADADGLADLVVGPREGPMLREHKAALLAEADVIVCSLPGTSETRHFFSDAEFGAMREGAIFISLGRGVAVDEAALVRALRGDRLCGAALDVFEEEPLSPSSALWDCENLLLTAHNADFTASYFQLGWDVWRQNRDRFAAGEPLATPVDTAAGY